MLFGAGPLFPFPDDPALPLWGMAACVGVGLAAGLLSGLLTALLYALEDGFERLPVHWMWWPALGGVVVGLGGLIEPRALGVGYDVIGDLLAAHMTGPGGVGDPGGEVGDLAGGAGVRHVGRGVGAVVDLWGRPGLADRAGFCRASRGFGPCSAWRRCWAAPCGRL